MAWSADGVHWTRQHEDLIPSRIEEDEAQASPDVFFANGLYHMFFCYRYSSNYRSQTGGYRIGYASSRNLTDWQRDESHVYAVYVSRKFLSPKVRVFIDYLVETLGGTVAAEL